MKKAGRDSTAIERERWMALALEQSGKCLAAEIDYKALLQMAPEGEFEEIVSFFQEEVLQTCLDHYCAAAVRPYRILRVEYGTFTYVFDAFETLTLPAKQVGVFDESRLVVACGRSAPQLRSRSHDDSRLQGRVGPTHRAFGKKWNKGHYIGHALGGKVDQLEVNVFMQLADVNRGRSADGKRFRKLEQYAAEHAGTLCFARPLYADATSHPAFLEFGVLQDDRTLLFERVANT